MKSNGKAKYVRKSLMNTDYMKKYPVGFKIYE